MKKAFFTLFMLSGLAVGLWGQQCLPNGITLGTQSQIDNFPIDYPGCTSIGGDVAISGSGILNLNGLLQITAIEGNLTIENNLNLTSLSGLDNLTDIGNAFTISQNLHLENISNLGHLTHVGGAFTFKINNQVTSLSGLENLVTIGGSLIIQQTYLEDLNGLQHLTSINGSDINVSYNYKLVNLNGLENIVSVGAITIDSNIKLTDMNAFSNLAGAGAKVSVSNCPLLNSLAGFSNMTSINGGLNMVNCPSLLSFEGLNKLVFINGSFSVSGLNMTDFTGLDHLKTISGLSVSSNNSLANFSGLESIEVIPYLSINSNAVLVSLNGLTGLTTLNQLIINSNPLLSDCSILSICNQLLNFPVSTDIWGNAPGCSSREEVEAGCIGVPVRIKVLADSNGDCITDNSSTNAPGIQVKVHGPDQLTVRPTSTNGELHIKYLDTGNFDVTLPQFPTANWEVCQDTFSVNSDTISDTARVTFVLRPLNNCPMLHTELLLPPFFRGCLVNSDIEIVCQNIGGSTAENTMAAVVLPDVSDIVFTTPPVSSSIGDTLFFDTGDLQPFESVVIHIRLHTHCDTFLIGRTLCIEAMSYLDNPCPPVMTANSDVRVYSECLSDTTVRFTLKNILGGGTQNPHEYIITEDEIVLRSNPFNLGPYGSMIVDVPANGATYRMEATQLENGTLTATANEGCGGFTPGLVTAFWLNYHLSDYDYDCREVIAGYDPNQKTAVPKGVGEQHLLPANRPVTYYVDFQNTGTDTVFRVLLRDVLSPYLDVNTFRPGASSHPYAWEIRGADTLEVLFQPIMLPDTNANETASHGWFSFTIDQKPDLANGTVIENTASIIFDYNPPIITNTTFHTIGEMAVSVDEAPHQQNAGQWQVLGNPTVNSATLIAVKSIPGGKKFELMDIAGKVLRSESFSGQRFDFERNNLPAGIYYFTIKDRQGGMFSGKIAIK